METSHSDSWEFQTSTWWILFHPLAPKNVFASLWPLVSSHFYFLWSSLTVEFLLKQNSSWEKKGFFFEEYKFYMTIFACNDYASVFYYLCCNIIVLECRMFRFVWAEGKKCKSWLRRVKWHPSSHTPVSQCKDLLFLPALWSWIHHFYLQLFPPVSMGFVSLFFFHIAILNICPVFVWEFWAALR